MYHDSETITACIALELELKKYNLHKHLYNIKKRTVIVYFKSRELQYLLKIKLRIQIFGIFEGFAFFKKK